jgi:hypothetical protein
MLDKLKCLLEGKTILQILPANKSTECICQFVLTDGSSFRLCATDLGFWVEETAGSDGIYRSLDSLFIDYSNHIHHTYGVYSLVSAIIEIDNNTILVSAPDGNIFCGNIFLFPKEDQDLLKDTNKVKSMSEAAVFGNYWRMCLSDNYDNMKGTK